MLLLRYGSRDELLMALDRVEGQLTGTLHAQAGEDVGGDRRARSRAAPAGSIFDGFPTGVAVTTACTTAARSRRRRARRTPRSG